MMMRTSILAAAALLAACSGGGESAAPDISVSDALIRTPPQGRDITAGYATMTNAGGADRLIGASAEAADRIELHQNTMEEGVMRMRRVEAVEIPAGGEARLEQGGNHLMIFGLEAVEAGDTVSVTLDFETAEDETVEFTVGQP
ncbi:copper chaperone PCu(A)C [Euryhalocaulis caribicus]|uniref:copper chaperone PCu(A)C n=1 Tax=Euryhalocaulis caribicus TaxID=1161401 RepID=UPI0003A72929|nr:copper chaperone PCu(A)C [Euryhalocaulis caribicus]